MSYAHQACIYLILNTVLFWGSLINKKLKRTALIQQFSNNINLYYCFYQFNKSLLNKNEFLLKKKKATDLKLLNGSVYLLQTLYFK